MSRTVNSSVNSVSVNSFFLKSKKHEVSCDSKKKKFLSSDKEWQNEFSSIPMEVVPNYWKTGMVFQEETSIEKEIEDAYDEYLYSEVVSDSYSTIAREVDSWFDTYTDQEYTSQEFRNFHSWGYISSESKEYYFGKNIPAEMEIPNWAIIARLAGCTPASISKAANISKKLGRELYSQFKFDWTAVSPEKLPEYYAAWKENMPETLATLIHKFPEISGEVKKLWKTREEKFSFRERVRENGQEFEMDSYLSRIEYVVKSVYLPEEVQFPPLTSVEILVDFLESLLCEDREVSDLSRIVAIPGIKTITSNPRKIFQLGNKYGNCLRMRAVSWDNGDGFVVETMEGMVFQASFKCDGKMRIMESKRKFNNAIKESDRIFLEKFLMENNKGK